jgi:hypothetical protein
VFPEGQISEGDQKLSRTLAEAFIRFASTGDPNRPEDGEHWPNSFTLDDTQLHSSDPRSLKIQVIGGPLGTGATYQTSDSDELTHNANQEVLNDGGDQEQIVQGYKMGVMISRLSHLRNGVLAREKILDRCSFVSSLSEKLGV